MKLFIQVFAAAVCFFLCRSEAKADSEFMFQFHNTSNKALLVWVENVQPGGPVSVPGADGVTLFFHPSEVAGTKRANFILWDPITTERIDNKEFILIITDNDGGYITADVAPTGFEEIHFMDGGPDGSNNISWYKPN